VNVVLTRPRHQVAPVSKFDGLRRRERQLRWLIRTRRAPKAALVGGRSMFRCSDIEALIRAEFAEERQAHS